MLKHAHKIGESTGQRTALPSRFVLSLSRFWLYERVFADASMPVFWSWPISCRTLHTERSEGRGF